MNSVTLYKAYLAAIKDADLLEYERRYTPFFRTAIRTSTDKHAILWQRRKRQRTTFATELIRRWRREDEAVAP